MPLFDHLSPSSRERLYAVAERVTVPAGERFIRAGDTDGDLFRVDQGSVEVVDQRSHPEVILDVLGPGAVVGEMAFLAGEPRSADVRAFEESLMLRWRADRLRALLDKDTILARDFYHAVSVTMVERVRSSQGLRRGPDPARASTEQVPELLPVRELAERVKSELLALEAPMRREDRGPANKALAEVWTRFLDEGGRLFHGFNTNEADRAGQVLARELTPYLLRSRTGDLCLSRPDGFTGAPALLRHLETGLAVGLDSMGTALDGLLLNSPTALACRERGRVLQLALSELIPEDKPCRVTLLHCGSGALAGAVGLMMQAGGELTCIDSNRQTLERLDGATLARSPSLSLRLVHEDLGRIALGQSSLYLSPQDVLVISGLLEYVPDLALVSLIGAALNSLAPGGVLVLDQLRNSSDRFVFEHLLTWATLRRSREPFLELLSSLGVEDLRQVPCRGAAMVLIGRAAA